VDADDPNKQFILISTDDRSGTILSGQWWRRPLQVS